MKKATKGALAAAAAGSLLLGGAGSLAFWTGTQDVSGGSINSGKLTLSAPNCTTGPGVHDWQYDTSNAVFTMGTSQVVPGDSISKVCDMTLVLDGSHIGATLALGNATITDDSGNTLDTELTKSATFTVDGAAYAPISAAGTYAIRATVTVALPSTVTSTTTQNTAAVLEAMTLLATQTHDGS